MQYPELRIDIVRAIWIDQMADTERLLTALQASAALHQPQRTETEVS